MRGRALVGAWLIAAGCSSITVTDAGLPPPDFCQPVGQLALLDEPEAYLNQSVTVHLAGRFVGCDGGADVQVDVQAALEDPGGRKVPVSLAVHSMPYADDGGLEPAFGSPFAGGMLTLADATFTPDQLGLYHLSTRFGASLGTLQLEIISMIDGRGPVKTVPVDAACAWFEVWNGLELCVSNDPTLSLVMLEVARDGAILTRQKLFNLLPTDAGLWTVSPDGGLSLLSFGADGGISLLASARLPESLIFDPAVVIPQLADDQGALLLFNGDRAFVARPLADGGVALTAAPRLPIFLQPPTAAILLQGEGAAVGTLPLVDELSAPGLCVLGFADAGVSCSPGRFVLGADRGTLWTISAQSGQFSAGTLSPGPVLWWQPAPFKHAFVPPASGAEGLTDQSQFRFSSVGASPGYAEGVPLSVSSRNVLRVPVLSAGGPALEGFGRWEQSLGGSTFGASPSCVWQQQLVSSEVRYLER